MTKVILALPGCLACKEVKKITKGKVKSISVASKKGMKIALKVKPDRYPFCVDIGKKGRIKKCDMNKFLRKFNIKLTMS